MARQRGSRRGRFELAIVSGGLLALALALGLPGRPAWEAMLALAAAAAAMTWVSMIVGFVPAAAAALFAPIVVSLSDPSWTLGSPADGSTIGSEGGATFVAFIAAAVLGAGIRELRRRSHARARARRGRDARSGDSSRVPLRVLGGRVVGSTLLSGVSPTQP